MLQTLQTHWQNYRRSRKSQSSVSSGSAGESTAVQITLTISLIILLVLTLVPVAFMIVTSLKNRGQIYTQFWALPNPALWENYLAGWQAMQTYIVNSLIYGGVTVVGVVLLSSLSGYVFARHRFPGKEFIYIMILALLMIPGVLTLIPSFVLVNQLGIINTPWALIMPWIAGGQVFGILLCRSFLSTLPQELFEAAKIDGASELNLYWRVALPLSIPTMVTLAIMQFVGCYNEFQWALITITDPAKQIVGVGLRQFANQWGVVDIGGQMAGYAVSVIPLAILFTFGMKYYIQGVTAGALKA